MSTGVLVTGFAALLIAAVVGLIFKYEKNIDLFFKSINNRLPERFRAKKKYQDPLVELSEGCLGFIFGVSLAITLSIFGVSTVIVGIILKLFGY